MLDIKTAFLMWGVQALTLFVLLFAVWFYDRSQRHFLLFSMGFALNGTGYILHVLRPMLGEFPAIYVSNVLTPLALALWAMGLHLFNGRRISVWPLISPLIWVIAGLLPGFRESFLTRVMIYSITSALGHAFMAAALLTSSAGRYQRILAGLWVGQSLLLLGVGGHSLFITHPRSLEEIPHTGILIMLFMVCMLSTVILVAKIIMDKNEHLLKRLSFTDPLTGVLNRRGLIDAAKALTQKTEKGRLLALLVFDLDHFKTINDTLGHQAGDTVLCSFASMVTAVIDKNGLEDKGLFARSGGEEFCALVPVADLRQAAGLAEHIRTMVATTPILFGKNTVQLTTSIGVAALNVTDFDFDSVMRQADHGLYKAKADGRNRTAIARGDSVYCLGPALEPGSPAAIDQDTDLQVAALRRLTQRQLHNES